MDETSEFLVQDLLLQGVSQQVYLGEKDTDVLVANSERGSSIFWVVVSVGSCFSGLTFKCVGSRGDNGHLMSCNMLDPVGITVI